MICHYCGAPLPDTAKMCYICKTSFYSDVVESKYSDKMENAYDTEQDFNKQIPSILIIRIISVIVVQLGAALCIIGPWLSFYNTNSLEGGNVSYIKESNDAYAIIVFALAAAVICLYKKGIIRGIGQLLAGGLIMIITNYDIDKASQIVIQREGGFYLLMIGSFLIMAGGVVSMFDIGK